MYILLKKGNTCINKVFKEDYMRKNARRRNNENKSIIDKILIYSSIAVAIMSLILIGLFLYSKSLNESTKNSTMTIEIGRAHV